MQFGSLEVFDQEGARTFNLNVVFKRHRFIPFWSDKSFPGFNNLYSATVAAISSDRLCIIHREGDHPEQEAGNSYPYLGLFQVYETDIPRGRFDKWKEQDRSLQLIFRLPDGTILPYPTIRIVNAFFPVLVSKNSTWWSDDDADSHVLADRVNGLKAETDLDEKTLLHHKLLVDFCQFHPDDLNVVSYERAKAPRWKESYKYFDHLSNVQDRRRYASDRLNIAHDPYFTGATLNDDQSLQFCLHLDKSHPDFKKKVLKQDPKTDFNIYTKRPFSPLKQPLTRVCIGPQFNDNPYSTLITASHESQHVFFAARRRYFYRRFSVSNSNDFIPYLEKQKKSPGKGALKVTRYDIDVAKSLLSNQLMTPNQRIHTFIEITSLHSVFLLYRTPNPNISTKFLEDKVEYYIGKVFDFFSGFYNQYSSLDVEYWNDFSTRFKRIYRRLGALPKQHVNSTLSTNLNVPDRREFSKMLIKDLGLSEQDVKTK